MALMPGDDSEGSLVVDETHLKYAYDVEELRIVDGEGVFAYDGEGKSYLDCASGTFNLSLGYRHPAITKTIREQAEGLLHVTSAFRTDPVDELVRRLVDVAPANLQRVHLKVSGGSTANEGAIKLAQRHTGKRDVITLFRSHHGQTMAMTAISGNAFRREPFPDLGLSRTIVPDPYCHRCFYGQKRESCGLMCVDRIDDFIEYASSGSVAAIIVEPISGNGGNIVPPNGYLERLKAFCVERDIVLVFDEIQTGIGRTGSMFAAQHFGVEPDIITTAKGLGGGAQAAAILADAKLGKLDITHLSFTYGANLLAAAVANATVGVIDDKKFLDNVTQMGLAIREGVTAMRRRYAFIDDVRGVGLMIGFEVVDGDGRPSAALASSIAREGRNHGLLLRTSRYGRGNVVKIRPPLVIVESEAAMLLDRLDATFASIAHG